LLLGHEGLEDFRQLVHEQRASRVEIDISSARTAADVIAAMKEVLQFPTWCGSSWDSLDDAFGEIRAGWQFPLVMIVHGLPAQLDRRSHVGLETVLRLNEFGRAFSTVGDQLLVVFAGATWAE